MVVPQTTRLQFLVVCPSFWLNVLEKGKVSFGYINMTDLWLSVGQLHQYLCLSGDIFGCPGHTENQNFERWPTQSPPAWLPPQKKSKSVGGGNQEKRWGEITKLRKLTNMTTILWKVDKTLDSIYRWNIKSLKIKNIKTGSFFKYQNLNFHRVMCGMTPYHVIKTLAAV